MFDLVSADSDEIVTGATEEFIDPIIEPRPRGRIVTADETPDDRADAKETTTRRKLAYALYREDAYTYGAPVKALHDLPKADLRTYMLKADRIIGFAK